MCVTIAYNKCSKLYEAHEIFYESCVSRPLPASTLPYLSVLPPELVGWADGHGDIVAEFAEQRGVPTAIMSGHPAAGVDEPAAHSRPHLVKPFRVAELEVTIESVLKSTLRV